MLNYLAKPPKQPALRATEKARDTAEFSLPLRIQDGNRIHMVKPVRRGAFLFALSVCWLAQFARAGSGDEGRFEEIFTQPVFIGCREVMSHRHSVVRSTSVPRFDLLYIHGFADRIENHPDLFDEWLSRQGRVIGYELPYHGESQGRGIAGWIPFSAMDTFAAMGHLATEVESAVRQDETRPFIAAGWSTGGLLVTRMIQLGLFERAGRKPSGVILHAPGIAVRYLVGRMGLVTLGTLVDGEPQSPLVGSISPRSPLFRPRMAYEILTQSIAARRDPYPKDLPTLLVLGGEEEDRYVDTAEIARWSDQLVRDGARLWVVRTHLRHAVDWDRSSVGAKVRRLSADFAAGVAEGDPNAGMGTPPGWRYLN